MDTFQIECLKNGAWSNKIPTCKSKETKGINYNDAFLHGGLEVMRTRD